MKKTILIFCLTVCAICACNNENYNDDAQLVSEPAVSMCEIETVKNLKHYNDSLKGTLEIPFTRSWGTVLSVSAADGAAFLSTFPTLLKTGRRILTATGGAGLYWVAGGVFLGTVFITGGMSYSAYHNYKNGYSIYSSSVDYLEQTYENSNHLLICDDFLSKIDSMSFMNDSITIMNDSIYAYAAAFHNDILEGILPSGNANINSQILPPSLDPINVTHQLNKYGCALLSDQETADSLLMVADDMWYIYDYDIDEQLEYNELKGDISYNSRSILSLYFDAFFSYTNSLNDVNALSLYYHNIVSSSNELTQYDKICILMCIEITKSSFAFWLTHDAQ